MAACKVCKKSEVSMLCICEECLTKHEAREIAINALDEENDDLVRQVDELSARNRELTKKLNSEAFADYLIENASVAFEHQDRELLENAIKRYFEGAE